MKIGRKARRGCRDDFTEGAGNWAIGGAMWDQATQESGGSRSSDDETAFLESSRVDATWLRRGQQIECEDR